jgi:ABC-type glycerol-3-phosphate transport system substrate-binding protein
MAVGHIIERFTRLHPDIEVGAMRASSEPFLCPPLDPAPFGDRCATICRFSYLADAARRGGLAALDDFSDLLDVSMCLDGRLMYQTANAWGEWHIHGLPVQIASWMMIANQSLLRELGVALPERPITWEEFYEVCRCVSERGARNGIRGVSLELTQPSQSITRFLPYLYSANGGKPVIDARDFEPHLDAPGNDAFLGFLRRLWKDGLCHDDPRIEKFLGGKAAFRLSVTKESIEGARQHMPQGEFVALPLPVFSVGSASYTVIRGEFVGILANTVRNRQERQAAWEFIKFLLSPEAQEIAFREAGDIPARSDLAPMVHAAGGLEGRFLDYGLHHGLAAFDVPGNAQAHGIIQDAMLRAATGALSPAQALAEGQARLVEQAAVVFSHGDVVADHSLVS